MENREEKKIQSALQAALKRPRGAENSLPGITIFNNAIQKQRRKFGPRVAFACVGPVICLPRLRFEGPGLSPQSALVLCGTTNLQRFGGGGRWSEGTAFRRRIFLDLDFLARFGVCVGFLFLFGFRFAIHECIFLCSFPKSALCAVIAPFFFQVYC